MKLLPQLRIPWVARRWHDAEQAAKARLLDGCMEARRQDAERHGRLMRARDAQIAALTERIKIAEVSASELQAECSARVATLSRTLSKLDEVEKDRDLARSHEQVLYASIKARERQIEKLTTKRRDANESRERELEDILDLIDAARDYVLERRSPVDEGQAKERYGNGQCNVTTPLHVTER